MHRWPRRSTVSCCNPLEDGDSYQSDPVLHNVAQPLVTLGTCQVNLQSTNLTNLIVRDNDLVSALAPSLLSCTLTGSKEACGTHSCGDLTFTAQLDTYKVEAAVVTGDTTGAFYLDDPDLRSCGADNKRRSVHRQEHANSTVLKQRLGLNSTHKPAPPRRAPAPGVTQVSLATDVFVLSGPVAIWSKTHATKYEYGWVDFVVPLFLDTVPAAVLEDIEDDLGTLPRIDAKDLGVYKFKLFEKERD